MRYAYVLGYLAGTAIKAHRTAVREHHRDVRRLSDVVDTLIAENADLRAELVKARAEIDRAWGFDAEHIAEWERELVFDQEGEL